MTTKRRIARAEFSLTREYPASVDRVWNAFAVESEKLSWWGAGDRMAHREWFYDFRIGGLDVAEGKFHNGPVSRYEARYTDIIEHSRIITTYDMWLDGIHMSTSVASLEFEALPEGTRFTHAEYGLFFDQFWDGGKSRESGTRGIVDNLGKYLG